MKRQSGLQVPKRQSKNIRIGNFAKGVNSRLDPAVLSFDNAQFAYNYHFVSGVLREGFGLVESGLVETEPVANDSVMSVWIYNRRVPEQQPMCMIATKQGKVYAKQLGNEDKFELVEGIDLTSKPNAVTYRLNGDDVIIITTPTDGMFVWDGVRAASKIESVPFITSMTIHFERMFVTTADHPDAVWFSEDLDPTNFGTDLDQGGFIELIDERGAPLTALSYLNYVYIFREFGISRLTAYGAQEDFGTSNLFVSSGKIYSKTVSLCGDTVVFLASDGLYAFDGMVTRRILDNLTALIVPSPDAIALFCDGKYYLSLKMDFGDQPKSKLDEYKNNALLIVDMTTGSYSISRELDIVDIAYFSAANQVVAVLQDGRVGQIAQCGSVFGQPLKKVWRIGMQDLGDATKTKNIRQIDIDTRHDIELVLHTDRRTRTVKIKGSQTISKAMLNISCKLFGMDIISHTEKAYISRPTLRVVMG